MRLQDNHHQPSRHGFSMSEMVMVIALLGVLAAIVTASFSSLTASGKTALAKQRLEMLNGALNQMGMNGRQIYASPLLNSSRDEDLIVMTLQMRDEALVGSPYVVLNYLPKGSSDSKTYRMRYNGSRFELLLPGQTGTGLKVEFDGSDTGPPRIIPSSFRPFGS